MCKFFFKDSLSKTAFPQNFEKVDTNGNVVFGDGLECNVLVACFMTPESN